MHQKNNIIWQISEKPVHYPEALSQMEDIVSKIIDDQGKQTIWLLEHSDVYTAGSSASPDELVNPRDIPIQQVERGGKWTYHGPGQRVVYVMIDLNNFGKDIRHFVWCIEQWIIDVLGSFGIKSFRDKNNIGVWTKNSQGEQVKIAAIGIKVRKWVTFYGYAINLNPVLDKFQGIIPCGISNLGVTSIHDLGYNNITLKELDVVIEENFSKFLENLNKAVASISQKM